MKNGRLRGLAMTTAKRKPAIPEFPAMARGATPGFDVSDWHGMIVKYVPNTETKLHMHPDCESLFVFLEGNTDLTVDGNKAVGSFGKAAYLPCGNKHALHGSAGNSYFIEFHIPYNYTTVR